MDQKKISKGVLIAFITISFLGFLDASYLAAEHYMGAVPPCSIVEGCEVVTTSQYATIGGVSVALFGAIYYLAILILSLALTQSQNRKIAAILPWLTIIGFAASLWFVSLQVFVIEALCLYCLFSAGTSTSLFVIGMIEIKKKRKNAQSINPLQSF